MEQAFFFGYGSLVNRATHDYGHAQRASVRGWRRVWQRAPSRPVSFLSVIRDPSCTIDGLIAQVPGGDWRALDAREFSYERIPVTDAVEAEPRQPGEVSIYAITPDRAVPPDEDHPILLSYIDAVLQGFLREYGPDGAHHFMATTRGWEAPIVNDRAAPRYPRAQYLGAEERSFVDTLLAEHMARTPA